MPYESKTQQPCLYFLPVVLSMGLNDLRDIKVLSYSLHLHGNCISRFRIWHYHNITPSNLTEPVSLISYPFSFDPSDIALIHGRAWLRVSWLLTS
ncbi:hypothetical protein SAMN06265347_110110 [Halobellus salinus]|nr:hypothetical protein SAMN06265347_110110 [Halobellus salinus]